MEYEIVVSRISMSGTDNDIKKAIELINVLMLKYEVTIITDKIVKLETYHIYPKDELNEISVNNPNVSFKIDYADEDIGYNVGSFTLLDGIITAEYRPEYGTIEAYKNSIDITGDYFFVTEFLYSIEKVDMDNELPMMLIELAYNYKLLTPNYPKFIIKKFEELAVNDEDYEYAMILREFLKTYE